MGDYFQVEIPWKFFIVATMSFFASAQSSCEVSKTCNDVCLV